MAYCPRPLELVILWLYSGLEWHRSSLHHLDSIGPGDEVDVFLLGTLKLGGLNW